MISIIRDVRLSLRAFRRDPKFLAVSVFYLALGIGANVAIFAVVNSVLLDPFPFKDSNRLTIVWDYLMRPGEEPRQIMVSPLSYHSRTDQTTAFSGTAALEPTTVNLESGEPEEMIGAAVTSGLFRLLGVDLLKGREFLPEDEELGGENVVILSHNIWSSRFGSDPSMIGKDVQIDNEVHTVVGVLPSDFWDPLAEAEIFIPLRVDLDDNSREARRRHSLITVARLKPGATLEQAQAEIDVVDQRLAQEFPDTNSDWEGRAEFMSDSLVGDFRPRLLALQLSAAIVLLIVCVNIVNFILVRSERQSREIALHTALGATRLQLFRKFLVEGMILSFLGGLLGVGLAEASIKVSNDFGLMNGFGTYFKFIDVNAGIYVFALFIVLVSGLIFGLLPCLKVLKIKFFEILKNGMRSVGDVKSQRMLNGLAVAEVAMAVVLLVGAGLMLKSLGQLNDTDPGFRSKGGLLVRFKLPSYRYPDGHLRESFVNRLIDQVNGMPEARSAGVTTTLPMSSDLFLGTFSIHGRAFESSSEVLFARFGLISPGFLETMGIPMLDGRSIQATDAADAAGVVIINKAMADHYWPNANPIGQRIQRGRRPDPENPWLTVVGVMENVLDDGVSLGIQPVYYLPYAQHSETDLARNLSLVVHTDRDPNTLRSTALGLIRQIDPNLAISEVSTLDELVAKSFSQQHGSTLLVTTFAAIALLLAIAGIYGVVSYFVGQRLQEMGIRIALGAQSRDILRLIVGHGMRLALVGLAAGFLGAVTLTRGLESQLHQVSPFDPVAFLISGFGIAMVTLAASYIPARRAASTDPMTWLKAS